MRTEPLAISVAFEDGAHRLMATSYGRTSRAGERLFRAQPWPDIQFSHATAADAEADAATLTTYLNATHRGNKISKRALRTFGE